MKPFGTWLIFLFILRGSFVLFLCMRNQKYFYNLNTALRLFSNLKQLLSDTFPNYFFVLKCMKLECVLIQKVCNRIAFYIY